MVAAHGAAAPEEPDQVPEALAIENKLEDKRKKRKPRYVRASSAPTSPKTGPSLHITMSSALRNASGTRFHLQGQLCSF